MHSALTLDLRSMVHVLAKTDVLVSASLSRLVMVLERAGSTTPVQERPRISSAARNPLVSSLAGLATAAGRLSVVQVRDAYRSLSWTQCVQMLCSQKTTRLVMTETWGRRF